MSARWPAANPCEEARIPIDPPTSGVDAEILEHRNRRIVEVSAALAHRHENPGIAKADDIALTVAGHVGDEARVLVDAPTLIVAEIRNVGSRGWWHETAVAPAPSFPMARDVAASSQTYRWIRQPQQAACHQRNKD